MLIYMKDILQNELLALKERYELEKKFWNENEDESARWDSDSDRELIGVAKFIKLVAYKSDCLELLGIATKIELDVQQDLDQKIEDMNLDWVYEDPYPHADMARLSCIAWFYEENRYVVDMSKYKKIVDDNEIILKNAGLYDRLVRYVDEKKVLDKIYNEVKHSLMHSSNEGSPDVIQADELFSVELQEIYRKADLHLQKQLEKAKQYA